MSQIFPMLAFCKIFNGSRSQRVIVFYLGQMLEDFIGPSLGVTCMLQLRLMSQHLPGARGYTKTSS
jgi:hypothetical protein